MRITRWVAVVAAAAVVAGLTATGAATAAVGQQTRGVDGKTIKVAGLGYAAFYSTSEVGAQGRFAAANEEGINGYTIDFELGLVDDKSDPNTNLQEARRLVQQEQVFALVPTITPILQAAEFLNQQKVPTVGWGISAGFCAEDNEYVFGFTGCLTPPQPVKFAGNTWGSLIDSLLDTRGEGGAKGKTAVVITDDSESGKSGFVVIGATAKAVGMKVLDYGDGIFPAAGTGTVGDYTPFVNDVMSADNGEPPDVVFLTVAFDIAGGFTEALLDAGYEGVLTNPTGYAPGVFEATFEGSTVFTQFATPESAEESGNENMQEIVDEILAVDPDASIGQGHLAGWYSADFFVKVVEKATKGGKELTEAGFQKAASKFTYAIPDTVGPTKYPRGFSASTPCGQLVESDGEQYDVVTEFGCFNLLQAKKNGTFKEVDY